jgi:hypothetical protein
MSQTRYCVVPLLDMQSLTNDDIQMTSPSDIVTFNIADYLLTDIHSGNSRYTEWPASSRVKN